MQDYLTISSKVKGPVATIALNRPALFHAINLDMIRELTDVFTRCDEDINIRVIILGSTGKHFCAGADLNWMREGMKQSEEQLKNESMELAGLFSLMKSISPIILTLVKGKVVGGANGLVAASDLVIADSSSLFAFSEVKLGLVPATIAPFVVARLGKSRAAAWMLMGRWFKAREALAAGLVDIVCEEGLLEEESTRLINDLLSGGPEALRGIKHMLTSFDFEQDQDKIKEQTAEILARFRISSEGQEGINAFLEKRRPNWNEKN